MTKKILLSTCITLLIILIIATVSLTKLTGVRAAITALHLNNQLITLPGQNNSCSNSPSSQNCDGEDPAFNNCVQTFNGHDTQNVDTFSIKYRTLNVGFIQVRYSPVCKSYWVRAISFSNTPIVTKVKVFITTASGNLESINASYIGDGSLAAYTNMSYMQQPSTSNAGATFDYSDGKSITYTV